MATVGWRGLLLAGTVALGFLASASCNDGNKSTAGGGGGGQPPPVESGSPLQLTIQSVEVPAGGAPAVTFRATDAAGQPIDLIQEIKNGAAQPPVFPSTTAPRITLAQLLPDDTYLSAYERSVTGKPYIPTEGAAQQNPALPSATQATNDSVPGTDPGLTDRLVAQGDGVYRFQMSAPVRTDLDPNKSWTAAMWATRTLSATDSGHPANASLQFVPAGGQAVKLEVVTDAACNTCHGSLEAHDRRTGVQLCITCHSPQSTDPESGNTVDMTTMIHKIHSGSSLPSVLAKTPYRIVGFAPGNPTPLPPSAVHDFSDVAFPRPVTDCTACHQGADADRWNTAASFRACTACHDNVNFGPPAGTKCAAGGPSPNGAPCDHPAGEIPDAQNAKCSACHGSDDVKNNHVNQALAQAAKFQYQLVSATVDASRFPVVQFSVVDPTNGNAPYDIKTAPPFTATGGASSLTVDVAWPTSEFTNAGSGKPYGQPIAMNALTTATPVSGQTGVFQVTTNTPVPAGVDAITVVIEGHPAVNGQRIPATTLVQDVSLTGGTPPARRQVVDTSKCNACHGQLSAHGSNRNGEVRACQICHNPDATDKGRRTAAAPPIAGEESVDFKVLIHEVHGVEVRTTDVTIIGFNGSKNVFPVGLPFTGDCAKCHVGTSYAIPLADVVRDTTIDSGADGQNPDDNVRRPKNQAVCLACHDNATTHVAQYTSSGAERCGECHAAGGPVDVATVHPITPEAQPAAARR